MTTEQVHSAQREGARTAVMLRRLLHRLHTQNHHRHPGLSEWACPFGDCPEIRRKIAAYEAAGDLDYFATWVTYGRAD